MNQIKNFCSFHKCENWVICDNNKWFCEIFIFGYFCDWSKAVNKAARGLCSAWNMDKKKRKDSKMRLKFCTQKKSVSVKFGKLIFLSHPFSVFPSMFQVQIRQTFCHTALDVLSFKINWGESLFSSLQTMQLIIRAPKVQVSKSFDATRSLRGIWPLDP